jgi:hypothetical protein
LYYVGGASDENGCSISSELFATGSEKEDQKRPRSSLISSGRGSLSRMDARVQSHVYAEGMEEEMEVEVDGKPRKLLMFHGIILRSQLTVLLKNKIFFDENDRVS